jgi:hypothetical protein
MADYKKEIAKTLDGKFTTSDGKNVTINKTSDPKYSGGSGGSYCSVGSSKDHTTYVRDSSGKIVETKTRGKG